MKKNLYLILSLALAACLMFSACGKNASESDSAVQESPSSVSAPIEDSSDDSSDDASDDSGEAETGGTIAEYAAEMQEMVNALSDMYGDALKIELTTEGESTLIVTYTLLNDSLGLNAENIKESMDQQGESMTQLAERMESGGIASAAVIVKWIDTDGAELFSKEYK